MDSLDFQLQKRKKAGSNSASLICHNHYMEYSVTQKKSVRIKGRVVVIFTLFAWASSKMSFWFRWAHNSLLRRGFRWVSQIKISIIDKWKLTRATMGRGKRWEPRFVSFYAAPVFHHALPAYLSQELERVIDYAAPVFHHALPANYQPPFARIRTRSEKSNANHMSWYRISASFSAYEFTDGCGASPQHLHAHVWKHNERLFVAASL